MSAGTVPLGWSARGAERTPAAPASGPVLAAAALLFAGSATATVAWCRSMSAMGGMSMPGGWSMLMAWMRMPDQSWLGAVGSFGGMWVVMMVAMMLPSLVPALLRYRATAGVTGGRGTVLVAAGYFSVWTAVGLGAYPVGVALGALEMRFEGLARAVPAAVGVVVLCAGLLQLTPWKARLLACCRDATPPGRVATARAAWRYGRRLGVRCGLCCAGPTAVLLVVGVMEIGRAHV